MKVLYFIIIILILIGLYEQYSGFTRQRKRLKYFKIAKERSQIVNKPLIVIGDPYNGKGSKFWSKFIPTYGCGDFCVDLTGCPKCENGIQNDILNYLKGLKDNSCVIFISCVLEYVNNLDEVIKELERVTGSNKNLVIVTVQKFSLASFFYFDKGYSSTNLVWAPPEYPYITYKKIKN
jgi:hypothetical protein